MIPALVSESERANAGNRMERTTKVADKLTALVTGGSAGLQTRADEFPLGRVGEPGDVTELVSCLRSARAAWMTGACIPIDGDALLR